MFLRVGGKQAGDSPDGIGSQPSMDIFNVTEFANALRAFKVEIGTLFEGP